MQKTVRIKDFEVGPGQPLMVMTGPCVIESEKHTLECAERLIRIFEGRPLNFVFKASYDKANRSAGSSFRGPGITEGLRILAKVKSTFNVPVVSDIHSPAEAAPAATVCDIIQIPAFLCRQTDLLLAAGETGAVVQVKKGQFMAPWDMGNVVDKVRSTGNDRVMLVDRGTCFGYNALISDMRAMPVMAGFGVPVCFDASHSVQLPGGHGTYTGGERQYIPTLARSAIAAGAHAIYMESHPTPAEAKSDSTTVWPMDDLARLLDEWERVYAAVNPNLAAVV